MESSRSCSSAGDSELAPWRVAGRSARDFALSAPAGVFLSALFAFGRAKASQTLTADRFEREPFGGIR